MPNLFLLQYLLRDIMIKFDFTGKIFYSIALLFVPFLTLVTYIIVNYFSFDKATYDAVMSNHNGLNGREFGELLERTTRYQVPSIWLFFFGYYLLVLGIYLFLKREIFTKRLIIYTILWSIFCILAILVFNTVINCIC